MNVLSLFDGKSSGYTALELAGFTVDNYYSSEIDKYAIRVSNAIHPNQTRLGDVLGWHFWGIDWGSIDLVLGGFPCQAWSMAGKQQGDKDERGMLFWYMLDIIQYVLHHNPNAKFLIENFKMKKEFEEYITYHTEQALGKVNKHLINSALVSAQNRQRYYWTNIKGVKQPEDKGVMLAGIIDNSVSDVNSDGWHSWWKEKGEFQQRKKYSQVCNGKDKAICMTARRYASWNGNFIKCGSMVGRKINPDTGKRDDYNPNLKTEQRIEVRSDSKSGCLTSVQKDNLVVTSVNNNDRVKGITENARGYRPHKGDKTKSGISELGRILKPSADKTDTLTTSHSPKLAVNDDISNIKYRKLTPRECFRLQTVPEHLIDKILSCGVSNSQLYKIAGNGWTDEVIAHIFSYMK